MSTGMDSTLLNDVRCACDIISTRRKIFSKPVSAKIWLLDPEDPRLTLDFLRSLINTGADAITIHERVVRYKRRTMVIWSDEIR